MTVARGSDIAPVRWPVVSSEERVWDGVEGDATNPWDMTRSSSSFSGGDERPPELCRAPGGRELAGSTLWLRNRTRRQVKSMRQSEI